MREHGACKPLTAQGRLDIHPPELERARTARLKPIISDQPFAIDGHPETSALGSVIIFADAPDFLA